MATDSHSRQAGLMEHYRRTLPYSADVRDVPTQEFLGARYWSDSTAALLPPAQQLVESTVGGGTRGWIFGEGAYPAAHFMRADVAIVKKASSASPTGFVYNISLQRDGNGVETSYLIRTGTIFPDPADASRRWVVEEAIMAISKADMNYVQSVADPLQLAALGNYQSVGSPKLVGWTMYSVPADDRHFPEGPGEPPIRPDQPLIYTLTAASGPFKDATNLILSYDEASSERQVAIVRGIV